MRGFGLLIAVGLSLVSQSVWASPADDSEIICVAVAHVWGGGTDDIRRIESVPVPESYLRLFNAGGCTRFQLVEASLVDWHFKFGNERTTTAALAFLEAEYTKGTPPRTRFRGLLENGLKAAGPPIRAREAELQVGKTYQQAFKALSRDRRVRQLQQLVENHNKYLFLAQNYLRAAEFFGSPALYAKARQFHELVQMGADVLYGPASSGLSDDARNVLGLRNYQLMDMRDLNARMSIMQVWLSRDPPEIDKAQVLINGMFRPVYRDAAEEAYDYHDFCNAAEKSYRSELKLACKENDNLNLEVLRFWRNQARLDLIKAGDPAHYRPQRKMRDSPSEYGRIGMASQLTPGHNRTPPQSVDFALRLHDPDRTGHVSGRCRVGCLSDERVPIYMEWADALLRQADSIGEGKRDTDRQPSQLLGGALLELANASQLVSPPDQPGRFRQVAESYIQIAERLSKIDPYYSRNPSFDRRKAYFRATLARLDAIKLGE